MEKNFDIIIIGGGPAGYTAALYGARAGHSTLVIEKMTIGGQMTETGDIDNYPGFDQGIDGITLGMKMQAGAERFGATTLYDEVASVSLLGDEKVVKTAYSGEFYGKTVIIATGAAPRKLGLPGEEELIGNGVHYCAHCDGRFYQGKEVAVVGGGNTAVGDALYLANLCKKVYLIHRRDTFRATKVLSDALAKAENVELLLNSTPVDLKRNPESEGQSQGDFTSFGAPTQSGAAAETVPTPHTINLIVKNIHGAERTLPIDGLFVSIGRIPSTELFRGQLELDEQGYIVASEDTKTSIPGVFAAGDVRTKELRQVITAAADGATSSHMAGEEIR